MGGWETRQDARPRGLSPQSPPGSTEADGWAVCTCRALESSGMPQSEGCGGRGGHSSVEIQDLVEEPEATVTSFVQSISLFRKN